MINNGGVNITNGILCVLVIIVVVMIGIILFLKWMYDCIHELRIQIKAITPESRALAHAYFKMLYEEHKKNGGNTNERTSSFIKN